MPLTDYQSSLARLLSANRTFDSYLAGGAAILIEPNTVRFSTSAGPAAYSPVSSILRSEATLDADVNRGHPRRGWYSAQHQNPRRELSDPRLSGIAQESGFERAS
jgi:hypothetical protein